MSEPIKQSSKEQLWHEAITKAKGFISAKSNNQMEVAKLALSVCEITRGGPQHAGKYTLVRFASEIGVDARTLSHWVGVRVSVYDKLPEDISSELSFTKLSTVSTKVAPDASSRIVIKKAEQILNVDSFDHKMQRYLHDLRTISWNFSEAGAALKCSKRTLQEFLYYAIRIQQEIRGTNPNLDAFDHDLAGDNPGGRRLSAAQALGLERGAGDRKRVRIKDKDGREVTISVKDRDVVGFLRRRKGKFVGPTEIGVHVGGRSRIGGKCFAIRTLNKLLALGCVERNKHGHYRWIGE